MPEVWYTSDTHFMHSNILGFCKRPWDGTHAMNKGLVERWNQCVKPWDTVYHLGDFSFHGRSEEPLLNIFNMLNGKKHLLIGNHDDRPVLFLPWESVQMRLRRETRLGFINMEHYPQQNMNPDELYLHGHIHTLEQPWVFPRIDVGVDANDWRPICEDKILMRWQHHQQSLQQFHTLPNPSFFRRRRA